MTTLIKSKSKKSKHRKSKKPKELTLFEKLFILRKYDIMPKDVLNQIWHNVMMLKWQQKCEFFHAKNVPSCSFTYRWYRTYKNKICVEHYEERYYTLLNESWVFDNEDRSDDEYRFVVRKTDTHIEREQIVLNKKIRCWHDKEYRENNEDSESLDESTYDQEGEDFAAERVTEKCKDVDMPFSPYEIYTNAFHLYTDKLQESNAEKNSYIFQMNKYAKELKKSKYTGKYMYKQNVTYNGTSYFVNDYNQSTKTYTLKKYYGGHAILNNIKESEITCNCGAHH
jgi:hypothetical protein